MKLLTLILRALVVPLVLVWIQLVWLGDQAREVWQKRKLGAAYEGPLDNEDLR